MKTYTKEEVSKLRKEWLNEVIELSKVDSILDAEIDGKYDVKRDFMFGSENEGSVDNGKINLEFKFLDGEEISFSGKVLITDIYEL